MNICKFINRERTQEVNICSEIDIHFEKLEEASVSSETRQRLLIFLK